MWRAIGVWVLFLFQAVWVLFYVTAQSERGAGSCVWPFHMGEKQISLLWRHRPMVGCSCHRRGSSVEANIGVSWRIKALFQDVLVHRVNSRQSLSLWRRKRDRASGGVSFSKQTLHWEEAGSRGRVRKCLSSAPAPFFSSDSFRLGITKMLLQMAGVALPVTGRGAALWGPQGWGVNREAGGQAEEGVGTATPF